MRSDEPVAETLNAEDASCNALRIPRPPYFTECEAFQATVFSH